MTLPPNLLANPNFAGTTPKPGWERSRNMTGTPYAGAAGEPPYINIMGDSSELTAALWGPSGTGVMQARGTAGQTVVFRARVRRSHDPDPGDPDGPDGSKWTISLRAGWTRTMAAVGKGYSNPTGQPITSTWQDVEVSAVLTASDAEQPIWVLFESEHTDPLDSASLLVEYGSMYLGIGAAADFEEGPGEPPADSPPSAPAGLAVTAQTPTTLTLAWTPATDDVGVVGYHVYEGATRVNPVLVQDVSYVVAGLAPESTHTYTVKAVDTAGQQSPASTAATGSTTAVPVEDDPPTAPASLSMIDAGPTSVTLEWTAGTDDVGVAGYHVYRGAIRLTDAPIAALTYTATGLDPATGYLFAVRTVDTAGQESPATSAAATTLPLPIDYAPTAPAGLTAAEVTYNAVTITWTAGADDNAVAGYNVYLGATKLTETPTPALTYTFTGLAPGTLHSIAVSTVDDAGQESPTAGITVATESAPDTVTADPWTDHAELAADLAPRVAAHVGMAGDEAATTSATSFLPIVAEYVRGYTRGRGWRGTQPDGPLKVVIVAAAARLVANPEQVSYYQTGDYTERPAVLNGWTLAELAILRRYRRTAA